MNITIVKRFYDVKGITHEEITNCLNTLGPVRGGVRYRAYTSWVFNYLPTYQFKNNLVYVNPYSKVNLTITFDLPRWAGTLKTPYELRKKITTYIKNITLHEEGHKKIAEQAAKDIELVFKKIEPQESLTELSDNLKITIKGILLNHIALQRSYDQETSHGHTQGAKWE